MFRKPLLALPGGALFLMLSCSVVLGCSGDNLGSSPENPQDPQTPSNPPAAPSNATIAYARGGEIRVVEPDGSNDHSLWTVPRPDLPYTVTGLAWKPDATELAFSSDHEESTSFYGRDIYAIGADGNRLRKLTNGPTHEGLAALPKGSVTLTVQNNTSDGGPWFVYVTGASQPQIITLGLGETVRLTFSEVADLGGGIQPAVAINGTDRWFGVAGADVRSGRSADAGLLTISPFGGVPHFGADVPAWRSDGSGLVYLESPLCQLDALPENPPAGATGTAVIPEGVFESTCGFDLGPASIGDQLLVVDDGDYSTNGETHIYRTTQGSGSRGTLVGTLSDYVRLIDIHWLPDGSGFIVARTGGLLDDSVNLYEYSLMDGSVHQMTTFSENPARRFSIAPDGRNIVFERASSLDGPSDLWIMARDGSGQRLLVSNAGYPSWNPQRP